MKAAISFAILAAAATSAAAAPSMRTTPKAVEPFAQCFASAQDRASVPWWFVPKENGGGTFSNAGAKGVRQPYFLDISNKGAAREIRMTAVTSLVLRAVERCI